MEKGTGGPGAARAGVRAELLRVGRRWAESMVGLVELSVRLDESGEWALDGSPTCAHWVADALGIEVCTAREWLRVGRCLTELPQIRERFVRGELSFTQVRALTRHATVGNEAELLAIAARERAGRLGRVLAAWAARHDDDEQRDRRQRAQRSLRWSIQPDGMVALKGYLTPQQFAFVSAAIDAELRRCPPPVTQGGDDATGPRGSRSRWPSGWPSLAQQRVDALVRLLTRPTTSTGGGRRRGGGQSGSGVEVIFHVRGDGASLDDGTPITMTAVAALVDEAMLRVMIHDAEGRPLNVSSRHRYHSLRQRRLVKERDRCCVSCGSDDLLVYHHEPPYETTGRTLVEETQLLCAACHHRRHRRGGPAAGSAA